MGERMLAARLCRRKYFPRLQHPGEFHAMHVKRWLRILAWLTLIWDLGCRPPADRFLPPGEIPGVIVHEVQRPAVDWGFPSRRAGLGFVWPEHRHLPPLQRPQTEEISLPPGQPFAPYLILHVGQPITVLVTAILDYQQIPFELNGKYGMLHLIPLLPGGDIELPMRIDLPEEGLHDLIVIAFLDPLDFSTNPFDRLSMDPRLVGRRARIRVGLSNRPAREMRPVLHGAPIPRGVTLSLGVALVRPPQGPWDHPSRPGRQLTVVDGKVGQPQPIALWASNLGGDKGVDYALIFFWNFRQIPFRGREVWTIHLEPDTEAILAGEVILPSTPGIYQMQVVYVFDPYRSIREREVWAPFVLGSQRIAIRAEDP